MSTKLRILETIPSLPAIFQKQPILDASFIQPTSPDLPASAPIATFFNIIERKNVIAEQFTHPPTTEVEGAQTVLLGNTSSIVTDGHNSTTAPLPSNGVPIGMSVDADDDGPREGGHRLSIKEMFQTLLPNSRFFANPTTKRLICSINEDFSVNGCSFCAEKAIQLRENILKSYNALQGYFTKVQPHGIPMGGSTVYNNHLIALDEIKRIILPLFPPTTPEEEEIFKVNHHNVHSEDHSRDDSISGGITPTFNTNPNPGGITPTFNTNPNPSSNPETDLENVIGTTVKTEEGKRFYLHSEGVHLTYAYAFDPHTYIRAIQLKFQARDEKDAQLVFYSVVNEIGATGNHHTHVALLYNKKFKTQSSRCFDYRESDTNPSDTKLCHPNIQTITGKVGIFNGRSSYQSAYQYFANTILYHRKQGTPVTNVTPEDLNGMLVDNSAPARKATFGKLDMQDIRAKTVRDLIKVADTKKVDPRDIPRLLVSQQIVREYGEDASKETASKIQLFPIQDFLLKLSSFENDRVVIWVADQRGGMGKSYLANMMAKRGGTFIVSTTCPAAATRALKNYIDKWGYPTCIIIDLVKSTFLDEEGTKGLYRTIEMLKGQYITSTKYDSSVIEQKVSPTVMIFSNSLPKINMLSIDRWVLLVCGILPNTFDYAFLGKSGDVAMGTFYEYIERLNAINRSRGIPVTLTDIIRTATDIWHYPGEDKLTTEYLRLYWDRGVYPIFQHIYLPPSMEKPTGTHDIKVMEVPLSDDEKAKYEEWKANHLGNSSIQRLALSAQEAKLREQMEAKLEEYSKSLLSPPETPTTVGPSKPKCRLNIVNI